MQRDAPLTFLNVPAAATNALDGFDVALIGAPEATPYRPGVSSHAAGAPRAVREAMRAFAGMAHHHDFDFDGPLLDFSTARLADCGDVAGDPVDPAGNRARIEGHVREILSAGARPIVLGGDDSVPIPVFSAFEGQGPLWVIQIDAHIDWRDERFGERMGWSSPMRRASEMPWVEGIVQLGIRGVGSAEPKDVETAEAWGARLVTAREIHERGVVPVLAAIPDRARCIVSLDCDGLDPSVMPAVQAPAPGGLTYYQVLDVFAEAGKRLDLMCLALVELVPENDPSGRSAKLAGRLVCAAAHAMGQAMER